jgi:hypothetical protein
MIIHVKHLCRLNELCVCTAEYVYSVYRQDIYEYAVVVTFVSFAIIE